MDTRYKCCKKEKINAVFCVSCDTVLHSECAEKKRDSLQLCGVGLADLDENSLKSFPDLEELDVRGNSLRAINFPLQRLRLKSIYLAENKWNCGGDLDVLLEAQAIIKDYKNLTCHQLPYDGRPLFAVAHFLLDVKINCTPTCDCSLFKVVQNPHSDAYEPIVVVNCSGRGFTELPSKLPLATKILHLENNAIRDLRALKTPIYRNLLDLYLDNNSIKTIRALEGSYWLTHFRVFSLSNNRLTELPSYALDNALQQNHNMPNAVIITLGGNPWRCDCHFTPMFQEMLRKYANQVKDLNRIKCSYMDGDENSLRQIMEISRSSVCRSHSEYTTQEALNLLNGVLAFLIVFVLTKLAYDYYNFKKTGRLPWIVTKMP